MHSVNHFINFIYFWPLFFYYIYVLIINFPIYFLLCVILQVHTILQ